MLAASLRGKGKTAAPDRAGELTIPEMLADPVVRAVMAVDHVRPADVLSLFRELRRRLGSTAVN